MPTERNSEFKVNTYRSNSLTEDEQQQLFRAADKIVDYTLFRVALQCAMRREDVVNIEIANIDLDKATIRFWEKKKRRYLVIPLLPDLVTDLRRYIATLPKSQRYLFAFSSKTAYNKLQATMKKAAITKEISFHDLRRTFMKTAKKRGLSIQAVSAMTGDSFATIERYYLNLDMNEVREELRKLEPEKATISQGSNTSFNN